MADWQVRYQGELAVFLVERRFGFGFRCLLPPYGLFASGIRFFGDWTVEAWLMVVLFPVGTGARPGFIGRCTGRRGSGMPRSLLRSPVTASSVAGKVVASGLFFPLVFIPVFSAGASFLHQAEMEYL